MDQKSKRSQRSIFFYAALAIIAIYFVYFAILLVHLYATFHEYSDFGLSVYGLYFNVHFPQIAHGLQLLEFDQHLSPDALLLSGVLYLSPSPITLLLIQDVAISVTALIVLFMVRDLTKSDLLAFAFSLAFLLNLGTLGLMLFDSHIEFLITPFYLLTIYCYVKGKFNGFILSAAALLGSADVSAVMGFTLALGLIAYELVYNRKRQITNTTIRYAIILAIMSLIAIGLYSMATSSLAHGYANGSYPGLPQLLYITNGAQSLIGPSLLTFIHNPIGQLGGQMAIYLAGYKTYLVYAVLLLIFGFGITLLADPLVALLVAIPWISGAFLIGNPAFLTPTSQYFGYVIGPIISASLLGLLMLQRKKGYLAKILGGLNTSRNLAAAILVFAILFSVVGPAMYLLIYSPASAYHSIDTGNVGQLLTFHSNSSSNTAYAQLRSAIIKVPQNASLLTDYFVEAHLSERKYVEVLDTAITFQPDYILADPNLNISSNACNAPLDNCTQLGKILSTGNYSVYFRNGTAVVYKRIG